jgi:fatty acid desaturase
VIFITDTPLYFFYYYSVNKSTGRKKMKFNVGGIDRILRIVVGLAFIGLAATGTVGAWGWIGVVPLLTGSIKFCPLYSIVGISSCPSQK